MLAWTPAVTPYADLVQPALGLPGVDTWPHSSRQRALSTHPIFVTKTRPLSSPLCSSPGDHLGPTSEYSRHDLEDIRALARLILISKTEEAVEDTI